MRPNPLALSCAAVTRLDPKAGVIGLSYIDAEDGSPLLDLKPYTPSLDRVEDPPLPAWCATPGDVESGGDFPGRTSSTSDTAARKEKRDRGSARSVCHSIRPASYR